MKILKLGAILVFVIITPGCTFTSSASPIATSVPTSEIMSQDNATVLAKTQANLAQSKIAATAWQPDAQFIAQNFNVPADLKTADLTQTFVFGSSKDTDNWWTYSFDNNGKTVRAEVLKDDYLGRNLITIDEHYLKTSYAKALKIADDSGGIDFRAKYPDTTETLTLTQSAPNNWLWYVITYQSSTNTLKIRISANDAKVYNDYGAAI